MTTTFIFICSSRAINLFLGLFWFHNNWLVKQTLNKDRNGFLKKVGIRKRWGLNFCGMAYGTNKKLIKCCFWISQLLDIQSYSIEMLRVCSFLRFHLNTFKCTQTIKRCLVGSAKKICLCNELHKLLYIFRSQKQTFTVTGNSFCLYDSNVKCHSKWQSAKDITVR